MTCCFNLRGSFRLWVIFCLASVRWRSCSYCGLELLNRGCFHAWRHCSFRLWCMPSIVIPSVEAFCWATDDVTGTLSKVFDSLKNLAREVTTSTVGISSCLFGCVPCTFSCFGTIAAEVATCLAHSGEEIVASLADLATRGVTDTFASVVNILSDPFHTVPCDLDTRPNVVVDINNDLLDHVESCIEGLFDISLSSFLLLYRWIAL